MNKELHTKHLIRFGFKKLLALSLVSITLFGVRSLHPLKTTNFVKSNKYLNEFSDKK